jgi:hypothetical protein
MGSTFGAIHVKGVSMAEAVAWVHDELTERGFVARSDSDPERDLERRILVFEEGGWVIVADEDHFGDSEMVLARSASASLDADVLAISVFHSDSAILTRFRKGDRVGQLEVPDGGTADEATGHRHVQTKFLADLAVNAEARRELEAGLLADYTFPESTVYRAAELIDLPTPSAGAAYLWPAPPAGAKKLRFVSEDQHASATAVDDSSASATSRKTR